MSDTTSSNRTAGPSPVSGDPSEAQRNGRGSSSSSRPPVADDQPTIISHQAPIAAPGVSDSAYRVLQGNLLPGDRLGDFELLDYVGGGGMGRVFRALDTRLGRTVAVKVLPPEQAADQEILLRFQNEAQSAARLDHDNIARVFFIGEHQGLHYIVFEFIDGVNIRRLVEQQGPLLLSQAVSYALQVAEALTHAAEREVVHRDVKPSNVLITPQGRVKLIDMGLARLQKLGSSSGDLTASGVTLGTFDYISPEQARDPRNADARSDLYSLGCTLFYMLTGRPPFPEGTVLQKLLQHQGDEPPDVREFRPELPDEVAHILGKTLAKDPGNRYQSPAELADDLTLLAYQLGLRPAGSQGKVLVAPQQPRVTFLQRHLPWIVPVAALVCIVFLLDFLWSSPSGSVSRPPLSAAQDSSQGPSANSGARSTSPAQPTGTDESSAGSAGQSAKAIAGGPAAGPEGVTSDTSPPLGKPGDAQASTATGSTSQSPPAEGPSQRQPATNPIAAHPGASAAESEPVGAGISVVASDAQGISAAPDAGEVSGSVGETPGGAVRGGDDGPLAAVAPRRSGLLVVSDAPKGNSEFATLGAACSAAANNDVIELRYNGRRPERPITLTNQKITIRAGKGYQPVVVFRPTQVETDPVKYPRSMFTLTAGRLTMINLALELRVPRDVPADKWALLEVHGGQTIQLNKCSLSIDNASDQLTADHEEVAFFYVASAPGANAAASRDPGVVTPFAVIELADCIARGEAVFLRATQLQPVHLLWDNGLLVTTERLLLAEGGQHVPGPGDMLHIDLRHLTAMLGSGFCRLVDTPSGPQHLNAQICCADSILMATPGAPFIEQAGEASLDEFRRQISFSGDRDFYQDFDFFWIIRSLDQEDLTEPMSFEAWKLYWSPECEHLPECNRVIWKKLPGPDRPLHTHTPADYTLSDRDPAAHNPALGAASDGSNAGFRADRLPFLPPPAPTND